MSPVVCGQTVRHFMAIKLIEIQSVFPLLIWPGVKISGQIRDSKDWCGVCWSLVRSRQESFFTIVSLTVCRGDNLFDCSRTII